MVPCDCNVINVGKATATKVPDEKTPVCVPVAVYAACMACPCGPAGPLTPGEPALSSVHIIR
jgi:hypothetical protein